MGNIGAPEIVIGIIGFGLLVLWVMGVLKLFQKDHRTLGWVAIVGIIIPILALVGYAGWFVDDRSSAT
jgi:cytochrome bd-type quinol oxidase subunit 1